MENILFIPVLDYFKTRKRLFVKFLFPLLFAIITLVFSLIFDIGDSQRVVEVFSKFIDTQINIIAILISFSVAIITILVSSDNQNIKGLKETKTKNKLQFKSLNGQELSLFQILLSNIAYNVEIEVIYLFGLIAISLIQAIFPVYIFKYITAVCIFFVLHIFLVLLEAVVQMYLTFWTRKCDMS